MPKIAIQPIIHDQLGLVHTLILDDDLVLMTRSLGFIPTLLDVQRQTFNDPDFEPDLFLGAFLNSELVGCVLGIRRLWKEGQKKTGFIKWVIIDKRYRRQGVARMLLQACEVRLRDRGSTSLQYGSSSPLYLFPGIPKEAPALCALLKANGWQNQSERTSLFINLEDLNFTWDDLEKRVKGYDFLRLLSAVPENEREVARFVEQEFTASWAKEAGAAIGNPDKAFCSILRDYQSKEVIGFAAVNGTNPNWFGPMGVKYTLRKQGLGHLLVYHTLLTAQKRGMNHLLIPWINGKENFYRKFVTKSQWQMYYKFEKTL